MSSYGKYQDGELFVLEKDMPQLAAGTIFELREATPERGSLACGYMTNIWVNGNSQHSWAEGTHMVPGQLATDREWFTPVQMLNKQDDDVFVVNDIEFKRLK